MDRIEEIERSIDPFLTEASRETRKAIINKMMSTTKSITEQRLISIHEKLDSWNGFVTELKVPSELNPAILTGRLDLLKLAKPTAKTADEVKVLYDLIGALLETNAVLREHSIIVSELAEQMTGGLKGTLRALHRMQSYAKFENAIDGSDEDD